MIISMTFSYMHLFHYTLIASPAINDGAQCFNFVFIECIHYYSVLEKLFKPQLTSYCGENVGEAKHSSSPFSNIVCTAIALMSAAKVQEF